MDPVLLDVLTKLGFAGLCIWLIYDTRQEARKREDRMADALNKANNELAAMSERSAVALEAVATATHRMADVLQSKPCGAGDSGMKAAADQFQQTMGKGRA